jgi:hypothetical protein
MELATDDLASLWATCSFMCKVCDTAEVGQRIPLRRLLQRQGFWERHYYDNDYHTLLTTMLASVGTVTEPTNYTKLSKKITARADNLANLSHITQ